MRTLAWDKYGPESFTWVVLEITEKTRESLLSKEQEWLDKGFEEGNLYNVCKVAGSHLGVKRSEETKQKLREALLRRGGKVEFDRNDAWKKQVSDANKANANTRCGGTEFKEKMRKLKLGNTYSLGKSSQNKGRVWVHDEQLNTFMVEIDDSRIISNELKIGRPDAFGNKNKK